MPNHTTNKLTIEGASVDQFIEDAHGKPREGEQFVPLSFESLLPTPAELMDGKRAGRTEYTQSTHHMPDWYEWRLSNWGTKWDAYDFHGEWQPNSPTNYSLTFFTAWNAPTKFFERVSKDYPDITFVLDFADEGGAFLGRDVVRDGEMVEKTIYEWCSDEGKEFRQDLGIYFEEEEPEEC